MSKAPLTEAFARRDSLKQVAIAFFAIMCAQGAVWYFAFFYLQVFLEKSLGLAGPTKDMLLIAMTLVSAPLYVLFGALSDRSGASRSCSAACCSRWHSTSPAPPHRQLGQSGAGRGAAH